MRSNCSLRLVLALSASAVFSHTAHAQIPTTRFVATNSAFNGSGCGARERPCRTIAQAVLNAADGDLIEVGPGTYTGTITIGKSLEIYSTAGAALTLIRDATFRNTAQVDIQASGVTFGRLNGGFTLVGNREQLVGIAGVNVGGGEVNAQVSDVTISGNVIVNHTFGIMVTDHASRTRIEGNTAIHMLEGFEILGPDSVVIDNVASDNDRGFFVGSRWTTFSTNTALGNGVGIDVGSQAVNQMSDNSIIGNTQAGLRFLNFPQPSGRLVLRRNNFYGNGDFADGCGVSNFSGLVIDATHNYWGKADGPGPNPGDRAYGTCLFRGSTLTTPFSATPFPVGPSSQ